jgi:signal transduction histidine kinase
MFGFLNRLYVKVYLTIVATLFLVVAVSALVWRAGPEAEVARKSFEMAGALVAAALADPNAAPADQQKAVDRLAGLLETDLALYDADNRLLAASGSTLPAPPERRRGKPWFFRPLRGVWSFRLPDGRVFVARAPFDHDHDVIFFHIAVVALLLGVGAFPVVRGLTRRLERLQRGVESLGAGDLSTRVKVEGKDEVARVAESFNRAAKRIEELVGAHRMLLAHASHELRTPLTRLRMGIELLKDKADPERRAELERDIAELDQLIDEILLSSRLDALHELEHVEDVDLLALAAEEAARFEHATVTGAPVTVRGDARLLRRLVRNLIENAERHGAPPIEIEVAKAGTAVELRVLDHGPGIAEADRERIFEPFFRATVAGETRAGAGLGLALVRQIARRHGGDVKAVRGQDGRSGFVVSL